MKLTDALEWEQNWREVSALEPTGDSEALRIVAAEVRRLQAQSEGIHIEEFVAQLERFRRIEAAAQQGLEALDNEYETEGWRIAEAAQILRDALKQALEKTE